MQTLLILSLYWEDRFVDVVCSWKTPFQFCLRCMIVHKTDITVLGTLAVYVQKAPCLLWHASVACLSNFVTRSSLDGGKAFVTSSIFPSTLSFDSLCTISLHCAQRSVVQLHLHKRRPQILNEYPAFSVMLHFSLVFFLVLLFWSTFSRPKVSVRSECLVTNSRQVQFRIFLPLACKVLQAEVNGKCSNDLKSFLAHLLWLSHTWKWVDETVAPFHLQVLFRFYAYGSLM